MVAWFGWEAAAGESAALRGHLDGGALEGVLGSVAVLHGGAGADLVQVFEAGASSIEEKLDHAGGAVTVFSDVDFG